MTISDNLDNSNIIEDQLVDPIIIEIRNLLRMRDLRESMSRIIDMSLPDSRVVGMGISNTDSHKTAYDCLFTDLYFRENGLSSQKRDVQYYLNVLKYIYLMHLKKARKNQLLLAFLSVLNKVKAAGVFLGSNVNKMPPQDLEVTRAPPMFIESSYS